MTYERVNKAFTDIVSKYLDRGYIINTGTMSGMQSNERMKVDLTNGQEIIRVWMTDKRESTDSGASVRVLQIIVGRCADYVSPNESSGFATIWNDRLEELDRKSFYVVCENKMWLGSQQEAIAAQEVRRKRLWTSDTKDKLEYCDMTDKTMDIACRYLRRKLSLQRVRRKYVQVVRTYGRYVIMYCGVGHTLR